MAQAHPQTFLPQADGLIGLGRDLDDPALSELVDRRRAAQHDVLAAASEQDRTRTQRGDPAAHAAQFLALTMALLEAADARTIAHCSHLSDPPDPTVHRLVDLTTGWASCGCREQIRTPRPDDGRCNVCDDPPADGVLYEARLTGGPMHTFRVDVCTPCWEWIEPLYRPGADS
jgi:hypothetical protein